MSDTSSIAWEKRKLGKSRVILIENPRKRRYDDQSDPQGKHLKGTAHGRKQGTVNQSTLKYCKIMVRTGREVGTTLPGWAPCLRRSTSRVIVIYYISQVSLKDLQGNWSVACKITSLSTHQTGKYTEEPNLGPFGKAEGKIFPPLLFPTPVSHCF